MLGWQNVMNALLAGDSHDWVETSGVWCKKVDLLIRKGGSLEAWTVESSRDLEPKVLPAALDRRNAEQRGCTVDVWSAALTHWHVPNHPLVRLSHQFLENESSQLYTCIYLCMQKHQILFGAVSTTGCMPEPWTLKNEMFADDQALFSMLCGNENRTLKWLSEIVQNCQQSVLCACQQCCVMLCNAVLCASVCQ